MNKKILNPVNILEKIKNNRVKEVNIDVNFKAIKLVYYDIFSGIKKKPIKDYTEKEIMENMLKQEISFDKAMNIPHINVGMLNNLINDRIERIPILIDFFYVYYIHKYDKNYPIREFVRNIDKLEFIRNFVNAPNDRLFELFCSFINDQKLSDIISISPPYYIISNENPTEIRTTLVEIFYPVCHEIYNLLKEFEPKKQSENKQETIDNNLDDNDLDDLDDLDDDNKVEEIICDDNLNVCEEKIDCSENLPLHQQSNLCEEKRDCSENLPLHQQSNVCEEKRDCKGNLPLREESILA